MKPQVDYVSGFAPLDIRIGTIVKAEYFSRAKKPSYKLKIDFGAEIGIKQSSAQITQLYDTDTLTGRQVVGIVNFPPRNIAGFISDVLILGAFNPDQSVVLLQPEREMLNGSIVG